MFLIGFTGYSGSGKTTLAERVVAFLAGRGYSVSCVKDAHHRIDLDTPGKDTFRFRTAGARQVVLRTPERWALLEETPGGREPLGSILGAMERVDIVVLEGFKRHGGFPQIEVRRGTGEPPLWEEDPEIVAVASERPDGIPKRLVWLDINRPEVVADYVAELFEASPAGLARSGKGKNQEDEDDDDDDSL
ncbi:MAG: molybdopterin-guanine dinucleotide biosynthesis protein B [Sutterellaceae bacterium]|nr:molybdopterin-guanine dinucleotide biosynthesis protein B [Sutterellaceae bacterium]MDD7441925.1 molybdopterin-guanine dinucleotide biosynthesis protein B [Sutterellaceae bacterium]MDY2867761.1 molybdopterin-guanine dinucleotide biosynthesis protein B [Mesosutterella sp.]